MTGTVICLWLLVLISITGACSHLDMGRMARCLLLLAGLASGGLALTATFRLGGQDLPPNPFRSPGAIEASAVTVPSHSPRAATTGRGFFIIDSVGIER